MEDFKLKNDSFLSKSASLIILDCNEEMETDHQRVHQQGRKKAVKNKRPSQ